MRQALKSHFCSLNLLVLAFIPARELKSNVVHFTPVAMRLLILIAENTLMYLFCSVVIVFPSTRKRVFSRSPSHFVFPPFTKGY